MTVGAEVNVSEIEIANVLAQISQRLAEPDGEELHKRRFLSQSADFEAVQSELLRNPNKGRINKEASPDFSDLTDKNALYVVMRDFEGKLEGFASLRHFQIGRGQFSSHLERQYRRIYGDGQDAFEVDHLPFIVDYMCGDVVFLSDIFINKSSARIIDPSDLSMASFCLALLKWQPAWLYGFIKHSLMSKGIAARYRMTSVFPFAVRWKVATPNRRDGDWLLAMDNDHLSYVVESYRQPFLNEPLSGSSE